MLLEYDVFQAANGQLSLDVTFTSRGKSNVPGKLTVRCTKCTLVGEIEYTCFEAKSPLIVGLIDKGVKKSPFLKNKNNRFLNLDIPSTSSKSSDSPDQTFSCLLPEYVSLKPTVLSSLGSKRNKARTRLPASIDVDVENQETNTGCGCSMDEIEGDNTFNHVIKKAAERTVANVHGRRRVTVKYTLRADICLRRPRKGLSLFGLARKRKLIEIIHINQSQASVRDNTGGHVIQKGECKPSLLATSASCKYANIAENRMGIPQAIFMEVINPNTLYQCSEAPAVFNISMENPSHFLHITDIRATLLQDLETDCGHGNLSLYSGFKICALETRILEVQEADYFDQTPCGKWFKIRILFNLNSPEVRAQPQSISFMGMYISYKVRFDVHLTIHGVNQELSTYSSCRLAANQCPQYHDLGNGKERTLAQDDYALQIPSTPPSRAMDYCDAQPRKFST